jgi:transposase-like protein
VSDMSTRYLCADCNHEFSLEGSDRDPRCPQCGRTEAVQPADGSALQSDIWRQWLVVFAVLFIAGLAYLFYR